MWIVTLNDASVDEDVDVIASDIEELQGILNYVRDSLCRYELLHVEQRWMCFGLDGLKDVAGNDVPDKI